MQPKCILLDIEGTTSSISFVYDVMFPFVRENLDPFLAENWRQEAVADCLPLLAEDIGQTFSGWLPSDDALAQRVVANAVIGLMDDDVKATGLKKLQGQIWKSGFESGQMVAHVYEDVPEAIEHWISAGSQIRIYSSGSVQAQKLFFGHTVAGDLLSKFAGHYDTTIGSKKVSASYSAIAEDAGISPADFVFVSDVIEELQAAREAGMGTVLSIRPGNKSIDDPSDFVSVESFANIDFDTVCTG